MAEEISKQNENDEIRLGIPEEKINKAKGKNMVRLFSSA